MSKYLNLVNQTSRAQHIADALRKGGGWISKGEKEGSRGGNVIGHTPSGNAIYASKTASGFHEHHKKMSSHDHRKAEAFHESEIQKERQKGSSRDRGKVRQHKHLAEAHGLSAQSKHSANSPTQRGAHKEAAGRQVELAHRRSKPRAKKAPLSSIIAQSNKDNSPPGGWSDADKVPSYKSMGDNPDLVKGGGPFIGKRGGKWADSDHTITWKEGKAASKQRKHAHAGSGGGFLNDHKDTTHEEHSDLAQKHNRLAQDAQQASSRAREGSNEHYAHKHEARYHNAMTTAHQHMKVGKNSYGGLDDYDKRAATQARGQASEARAAADSAKSNVEANKPPRSSGGVPHSMGKTSSGKPMSFLSRENFRDHTDRWTPADHEEAGDEHRSRSTAHQGHVDKLQAAGKWAEAADHNKASRYHAEMDKVHLTAALGGNSDPGDRGDLEQATHAHSVASKSMGDNPDLVKGGGWTPVPNTKHQGLRKRNAKGGWDYWYKDQNSYKAGKGEHSTLHTGLSTADGDKMHVGPEKHDALIVHHQARADEKRADFKGDNSHSDKILAEGMKFHNALRMGSEAYERADHHEQKEMYVLAAKHHAQKEKLSSVSKTQTPITSGGAEAIVAKNTLGHSPEIMQWYSTGGDNA